MTIAKHIFQRIPVIVTNNVNTKMNEKLTFKNNALFRYTCIRKTNNTFIGNAEDLDTVMYNLLEYGDNYFMTSVCLWNYHRDDMDDDKNKNNANGYKINKNKITASRYFEYKTNNREYTKSLGKEAVASLKKTFERT